MIPLPPLTAASINSAELGRILRATEGLPTDNARYNARWIHKRRAQLVAAGIRHHNDLGIDAWNIEDLINAGILTHTPKETNA